MAIALLALHGLIAAAAPILARRIGRNVFLVCAVAPAATVAWAAFHAADVLQGASVATSVPWLPAVDLRLDVLLDPFSLLMVALVSGIGTLIFLYSVSYFDAGADVGKFAGRLVAFAGAMLGLVISDNLLILYVFWELTSITSYLLIGWNDEQDDARAAALQALFITGAGGLAMLGGFVLIGQGAGTYSLSAILADPPTGTLVTAGALLSLVGAVTKSAQAPFHTWLPGAMAAPTPVSAYLHSATMVKAGVYLVARFAPAFATVPGWRPIVLTLGVLTMILGGLRALRQFDLKLLLAYGTVSQLGFLMVLFGAGLPETTLAGTVLLLAHALFKAALFLVTGVVDHTAHTRDTRRLDGLWRVMPATATVGIIAAASMAGLPPLFGFIAKEEAYTSFVEADLGLGGPLILAGLVAGSVLTFAYSWRYVRGAFLDKPRGEVPDPAHAHAPKLRFLGPAAILAVLTVAFGLVPAAADTLVHEGAHALDAAVESDKYLALWHGFNLPLLLSAITIAAGVAMAVGRQTVEALGDRAPALPTAQGAYEGVIDGLKYGAPRITGVIQNGSLPTYLGVILLATLLTPMASLGTLLDDVSGLRWAENAEQAAVVALMIALCFGIVFVSRRFAAVLMLGGVGYAIAIMFVIQGAPDLALTQFLIETLALVIFFLVLRRLPRHFRHLRWPLGQNVRRGVAVLVGVVVFCFALVTSSYQAGPSVSEQYLVEAPAEAEGSNVVNVILVDFRGWDTFGEITVLCVATLGVAGLVLATRRRTQSAITRDVGVDPRAVPLDPDSTMLPGPDGEPTSSFAPDGGGVQDQPEGALDGASGRRSGARPSPVGGPGVADGGEDTP